MSLNFTTLFRCDFYSETSLNKNEINNIFLMRFRECETFLNWSLVWKYKKMMMGLQIRLNYFRPLKFECWFYYFNYVWNSRIWFQLALLTFFQSVLFNSENSLKLKVNKIFCDLRICELVFSVRLLSSILLTISSSFSFIMYKMCCLSSWNTWI